MSSHLVEAAFSAENLDFLYPFSFVVEEGGEVVWAGRSIRKLMGGGEVCGHWQKCFEVERPEQGAWNARDLESLTGHLVVLQVRKDSGPMLRFRGQVARLAGKPSRFIFLLGPSVSDLKEISAAGLTYTDFTPGDLVFDFLMLLQSERRSFRQSEQARQSLIWKNRVSDLLYRCSLLLAEAKDGGLHPIMGLVSRELGFDFGHVFVRQGEVLVSSGQAYCSELFQKTPGIHAFFPATIQAVFRKGEGIPGRVWEAGQLIWGEKLRKDPQFPRGHAVGEGITWSGIGVPVRVGGDLAAVLEFYTLGSLEELLGEKKNLIQFLETLSIQLAGVIERQRFAERERSQQAVVLASSNLSSLGEMAAGVAHEINNPLTAVLLGANQARQFASKGNPDLVLLNKVLERIERSAERIGKIVNGMRTLSRDGSGDPFVSCEVSTIVEDTLSVCMARFRNAGVELRSAGERASGLFAQCRPVQISQVLLNLLNNAFDAVTQPASQDSGSDEKSWVQIDVRPEDRWVEISVVNSGPKISRELAQQVMRPFFTTKPVGKGTGLGLSISRSIAETNGGSLSLDLSGEHTRFVLRLPQSTPAPTS